MWILAYVLCALIWLRFWMHRAVVNAQDKIAACEGCATGTCENHEGGPWKYDSWHYDDQGLVTFGSVFWPFPTVYYLFKYLIKPVVLWLMFPTRRTRRDRRLRKELRAQEQERQIAAQAATIGEQQAAIVALHEELGIPFPGQSK